MAHATGPSLPTSKRSPAHDLQVATFTFLARVLHVLLLSVHATIGRHPTWPLGHLLAPIVVASFFGPIHLAPQSTCGLCRNSRDDWQLQSLCEPVLLLPICNTSSNPRVVQHPYSVSLFHFFLILVNPLSSKDLLLKATSASSLALIPCSFSKLRFGY